MPLTVDVTHARGLDPHAIEVPTVELPFAGRPEDTEIADAITAWVEGAPSATDVVVCGIGGSALSARVFDALRDPYGDAPRLHVIDTVDPVVVEPLLRTLNPADTVVLGISKSGGTLETTATFLLFEDWLDDAARTAVVAGVEPNPLRERAEARGYACFPIPAEVGGRYSGLTACGLLPAACVGVEPRRLLAGAAGADPEVARTLAAVHHAAHQVGRSTVMLLPYGERLRPLGPWWAQLLGESLGKPGPLGPVGMTPIAGSGPADQHSLLQLLVEGPDDKLVVFVHAPGANGPVVPEGPDGMRTPSGQSLGAILDAERLGTEYALAQADRPSIRIELAAADAASVGGFLFTYMATTVYWAQLLGVDPFGQPGVELGKKAAKALLTGEPSDLAQAIAEHQQRS